MRYRSAMTRPIERIVARFRAERRAVARAEPIARQILVAALRAHLGDGDGLGAARRRVLREKSRAEAARGQ